MIRVGELRVCEREEMEEVDGEKRMREGGRDMQVII